MDTATIAELQKAWEAVPQDCRFLPASEAELLEFESTYGPIPAEYRWFLTQLGGGTVGSEWVDGIGALSATHAKFQAELGPGGWSLSETFVIGWDGAGNPFGIHLPSGAVLVEDHNFGGVHEMAPSFEAFLRQGLSTPSGRAVDP